MDSVDQPGSRSLSSPGWRALESGSHTSTRDARLGVLREDPELFAPSKSQGLTDGRSESASVPRRMLPCCFSFLACNFTSQDLEEWDTHCKSHFRGRLPKILDCPFDCDWVREAATGEQAWQARTIHIWSMHGQEGSVDLNRRPSTFLIQHLWREGIINNAQQKELRTKGRLGDQRFVNLTGSVYEDRKRRQSRARGKPETAFRSTARSGIPIGIDQNVVRTTPLRNSSTHDQIQPILQFTTELYCKLCQLQLLRCPETHFSHNLMLFSRLIILRATSDEERNLAIRIRNERQNITSCIYQAFEQGLKQESRDALRKIMTSYWQESALVPDDSVDTDSLYAGPLDTLYTLDAPPGIGKTLPLPTNLAANLSVNRAHNRGTQLLDDFDDAPKTLHNKLSDLHIDIAKAKHLTPKQSPVGLSTAMQLLDDVAFLTSGSELAMFYAWIETTCHTVADGTSLDDVRGEVIKAIIHSNRISLSFDWDPIAFLNTQYHDQPSVSFAEILCLVGTYPHVQCMPCAEYVSMIWPIAGLEILEILEHLFRSLNERKLPVKANRLGIALELRKDTWFGHRTVLTIISLQACKTLMIAEIICFLSTAFRVGPTGQGVTFLATTISHTLDPSRLSITHKEVEQNMRSGGEHDNFGCWMAVFNNPVVCVGYPIEQRLGVGKGLQVPLDVIATLACALTVVMYGGILMLKGVCSMLIPMLQDKESITWHYLSNEDFSWVSHNVPDRFARLLQTLDVNLMFSNLSNFTHFVGWSNLVQQSIGTPDHQYRAIRPAPVSNVGPGCGWDGITIGFSKVIEVSTKFKVGHRDSRLYFQRGGSYPRMMDVATGMSVVLYDVPERRAWLVDGANALLLLARTALSSAFSHGAGDKSQDIVAQFNQAVSQLNPHATAKDILLCDQIRQLPLYGDQDHPHDLWYFESLVLEQWHLLEEIRSRQIHLNTPGNQEAPIKLPGAERIEGFQFTELISCTGPLKPKYVHLPIGADWTKFPSKVDALYLFGASFGQLLQPEGSECKSSMEVPSGCDVLAAPLQLLNPELRGIGNAVCLGSIELADGLFWDQPSRSFSTNPCPCTQRNGVGQCGSTVTVLAHSRFRKPKGKADSTKNENVFEKFPNGAIMIGSEAAARRATRPSADLNPTLTTQISTDSGYESAVSVPLSNNSSSLSSSIERPTRRSLLVSWNSWIQRTLSIEKTTPTKSRKGMQAK